MIYTIGYGNKNIISFIHKLRQYQIKVLVDVRSHPQSRWNPNFNRKRFNELLKKEGINYVFLGDKLGGLETNNDFNGGVEMVVQYSNQNTTVVMCCELEYQKCHRYLTLTPEFEKQGVEVKHIQWAKAENLILL